MRKQLTNPLEPVPIEEQLEERKETRRKSKWETAGWAVVLFALVIPVLLLFIQPMLEKRKSNLGRIMKKYTGLGLPKILTE